ncbi:alkyl hydroperoxide reductase subunit F [Bacteroides sp. GD17]|jgi:alkyl hydroperoxide reductase subunit F|uniref:alkyl hydroperoxide reductase subunit F n=1 Tax=Bacteroides sp. GD17 TaxID=3139826 RepID=UPI0025E200F0|nr:alkyl hydroperoxide reductase subunit F [uncultured Bacteroides sp.]
MLETSILDQVRALFQHLEARYIFRIAYNPQHEQAQELVSFLDDVASCSGNLSCQLMQTEEPKLEFTLVKDGTETGIKFRGIPNGHEFTSLLLAVLNADGKGKNLPDEAIGRRIKALQGPIRLQTYVSLTCTNCPDVVQALNIMALLNPQITHEMVDGALYQEEVDALKIQGVPSVYANGKLLHVGRGSLGELLQKLEETFGSLPQEGETPVQREFDTIVLGGGPAGVSAAIYSARKGLRVAIVAERIGGQVKETVGIENLISVPQTTGAQLADALRSHIGHYPVEIFEERRIEKVELKGKEKTVSVIGGEVFTAPTVIIATGASWRKLNVEGETEYIGRGVAFCPHCDGPFYQGKDVAVIGGGNSGIEAAIDLAGICKKVTVFEFADTLKADQVLQEKARNLPNVEIFTSSQTTQVIGNGEKVTAIRIKDRITGEERDFPLDGIFVQIGLAANSAPFRDMLDMTPIGEIKIDAFCRTTLPGVYAAGDVSNVPYKQIVIAMGEGAKAALSAFDDRIRGVV